VQRFTGRRGYKWNAGNEKGILSTDEDESTMDPIASIVSSYPVCMHRYCCGYFLNGSAETAIAYAGGLFTLLQIVMMMTLLFFDQV